MPSLSLKKKGNRKTDFPYHYRAGNGIRTRDPNLGKVVLYH